MKPRAWQVFLLVVLLIAAGCRAPSPPPEPPVVILEMPTPTLGPRETPSSPDRGVGPRVPMGLEETRGKWFEEVAIDRGRAYYLPVEFRVPITETVYAAVIPYRPVPSVRVRVEVRFVSADGKEKWARLWAMVLRAFQEGDDLVIRGVEGVPNVFGNCRHFEVPAWLLESDRIEWEGAVFVRGKDFSCIPGPGIPDRLEAEDAVLMDMAETPEGPYVLYGRWSPERRYEFWMRRPDGQVEPVPLRYAYWNYVLEEGSICGIPVDPRFDAFSEIREGDVEKVGCFPFTLREPRKPERYVRYGPLAAMEIVRILNQEVEK